MATLSPSGSETSGSMQHLRNPALILNFFFYNCTWLNFATGTDKLLTANKKKWAWNLSVVSLSPRVPSIAHHLMVPGCDAV
jgi:hypothetical protein